MISMLGKTCPYCKERVKKDALVCRYCGRELDPDNECEHDLCSPNWIFAGFAGLTAGAALALVFGYWRERRRWQDEISDYSAGEEFDN
jgi:predicted amidophosphoribosyltransferase